jgi:hypothetical protein
MKMSVGPLGWLRRTTTIPKIPKKIETSEIDLHDFGEGRLHLRRITLPNYFDEDQELLRVKFGVASLPRIVEPGPQLEFD